MKNGKKAFLFTIGSVMLTALFILSPFYAIVAYADDLDTYSGELDPFTGEPLYNTSGIGEVSTLSNDSYGACESQHSGWLQYFGLL